MADQNSTDPLAELGLGALPAPTSPTTVDPSGQIGPTAGDPNARNATNKTILHSFLDPLGLGDLVDGALNQYNTLGGNASATMQWVYQQPVVTAQYPELAASQKAGHPMTIGQIREYRQRLQTSATQLGIPLDMVSGNDVSTALISGGVSADEAAGRMETGLAHALQAPQDYRDALSAYGVDTGHLAGFFLDPTKGSDVIASKAALGAAATEQGMKSIGTAGMNYLYGAGVTEAQAQSGFGKLAQIGAGQTVAGQVGGMTEEQKLQAVAGKQPGIQAATTQEESQRAQFQRQGNPLTEQKGVTALGPTNQGGPA